MVVFAGREYRMPDDRMFDEYLAVADNTAKLSDRRQTVSDLFLGINSLFLAAAGYVAVSNRLTSWWAVAIVVAITLITLVINSIWYRLIGRYRALISLRIHYLEALERALQTRGAFGDVPFVAEDDKPHTVTRGIYLIEQQSDLYSKGAKMGFFKLERDLVVTFIVSYILLALATAAFTYLVTNHYVSPLLLTLPIGG
jgi:hypothetical protein